MDNDNFFEDNKTYEIPARVVLNSDKFKFVRFFLEESKNISDSITRDSKKNIFLEQNDDKKEYGSLQLGDYLLISCKGKLINQFFDTGMIDENIDKKERSCIFIKKTSSPEYNEKLGLFNTLKLLEEKKFEIKQEEIKKTNLVDYIKQLEEQQAGLKNDLNQKSQDFKIIINDINTLKNIKNLEEANLKLEEQKNTLEFFLGENQWLEQIKPYFNIVESSRPNFSDEPLNKVKSKPLFNKYTKSLKGRFNVSDDFIHCYLLSLFTSLIQGRFLLLTGHIGTGKSKIAKETGRLMGGKTNMVAVRPAWLDASDLLGYFDPINNRYHATDFVRFLKEKDNNRINMILLDELNIARIENYGADVLACLSSIDDRYKDENKIRLFSQDLSEIVTTYQMYYDLSEEKQVAYERVITKIKESASIAIPKNALICGTLNIDGSTENLSPKMIDRSFMLKFPDFNGQLASYQDIEEIVNFPIQAFSDALKERNKPAHEAWNRFYDTYIQNVKDFFIPISNRVAKDYIEFYKIANFFGVEKSEEINAYFFYARILPRLRIAKADKSTNISLVNNVLDGFQSDLFDGFIAELNKVEDGQFVDYQHICG
ncbi:MULTISPECIES: hypothetical protein [unclassified Moraxella]|uniref:hypothetical protein n=1 Tax=unclassified Moraxella TaxID=2685852 RepID=UPI003AF4C3E2